VLGTSFVQQSPPMDDTADYDNDPSTDKFVLVSWADLSGNWPNAATAQLFTANLTSSITATGSTSVNFTSSSTAAGWTFAGTSAGITILPADGSLSGYVYIDANGNGKYDANEGLPGVTITLSGSAQRTVTTNDDGFYEFTNLAAGVYAVTETQPAACLGFDGPDKAGTVDGATVGTAHNPGDRIDGIALPAGKSSINNQFTESNLNPLFIPNRLLATSTQPVGSAAWRKTIRDTMTRAEQQVSQVSVAKVTAAKSTSTAKAAANASGHALAAASAAVAAGAKAVPAVVAKKANSAPAATTKTVHVTSAPKSVAPASLPAHVAPSQPSATASASVTTSVSAPLTTEALKPIVNEAIAAWAKAGLSSTALQALRNVTVSIADLSGSYLGWTEKGQVLIDRDAAGYGWFVDATPGQSEEFQSTATVGQLQAVDPRALDRMDLLTVVEHELGHVAGLGDLDPSLYDLMSSSLGQGIRRQVGVSDVDAVFAGYNGAS
jgi:large repetitive protein